MFSNVWKRRNFEGQSANSKFKRFQLDALKRSLCLKELHIYDIAKDPLSDICSIYELDEILSTRRVSNDELCGVKFRTLFSSIFYKYLQLARPSHTPFQNRFIANLVFHVVVTMSGERGQDFQSDYLWQLAKNTRLLRLASDVISKALLWNCSEQELRLINTNKVHLSYFGEFLYFTAIMHQDSNSPMVVVRRGATDMECLVIDEIAMNVTPKLGIWTFTIFNNCATNLDNLSNRIFNESTGFEEFSQEIQRSYAILVKKLRLIPVLNDYYDEFLIFICKKMDKVSFLYDEPASVEHLKNLESEWLNDENYFVEYITLLVLILRYVAGIFMFIRTTRGDFNFKLLSDLPKYLDDFSMPKNSNRKKCKLFRHKGSYESIWALVLAMSLLLNVFFIKNIQSDIVKDYVVLCNEIRNSLEKQSNVIKDFAREFDTFPSL